MNSVVFRTINEIDATEETQSTIDYIINFLQAPHPARQGSVCPFVKIALEQSSLHIGFSDALLEEQIKESIKSAINYQSNLMVPISSTIIVFNNSVWNKINKLHAKNLLLAMNNGFLLGVFGPESMVPSIHDKNFFPNRSPKNMLVIRTMIQHDLRFFTNIRSRKNRLTAYRYFASKFPDNTEVRDLIYKLNKSWLSLY